MFEHGDGDVLIRLLASGCDRQRMSQRIAVGLEPVVAGVDKDWIRVGRRGHAGGRTAAWHGQTSELVRGKLSANPNTTRNQ